MVSYKIYSVANMKTLTPAEISAWFREQAKTFLFIADTVDKTFSNMPTTPMSKGSTLSETISVEAVRELVLEKSMRVATIAKHFGVPQYEVEKIVSPPENGFVKGEQGWITAKWKASPGVKVE